MKTKLTCTVIVLIVVIAAAFLAGCTNPAQGQLQVPDTVPGSDTTGNPGGNNGTGGGTGGDDNQTPDPGTDPGTDQPDTPVFMELVKVLESGTTAAFLMGDGIDSAFPVRQVTLTRPYSIGKFEVTVNQAVTVFQWAFERGLVRFISHKFYTADGNRVLFATDDQGHIGYHRGVVYTKNGWHNRPVTEIRWFGAAAFCNLLSLMEGLEPCYDENWVCDPEKNGYRLPTEAEWEFAARGTDGRMYPWGNASELNRANSFASGDPWEPRPDGSFLKGSPYTPVGFFDGRRDLHFTTASNASPFGAFDMAGNVREFVNDWYGGYSADPETDPAGPARGKSGIARGGSWRDSAEQIASTIRTPISRVADLDDLGFRVVRTIR